MDIHIEGLPVFPPSRPPSGSCSGLRRPVADAVRRRTPRDYPPSGSVSAVHGGKRTWCLGIRCTLSVRPTCTPPHGCFSTSAISSMVAIRMAICAASAMTAVCMVSGGKRGKRMITLVKGANEEKYLHFTSHVYYKRNN
jgi:hypothetical protein